jgi:endonuclease III
MTSSWFGERIWTVPLDRVNGMTTKQAELIKRLLSALEKSYGRAGLHLAAERPLDHVVYYLIDGLSSRKAAEAGVDRLRKHFVDWNEVRVSSHREIESCLNEVRREDRPTTAANIKAALEYLFEARYRDAFSLACAIDDHEDALQRLTEIEGLDSGRSALVLYASRPEETMFIPFASVGRILMRVGAIKKTTSTKAIMAGIHDLVDPKDHSRLTYLLVRHGYEVCGVKSYYCTQCRAASLCMMGRRRIRAGRATRKKNAGEKTRARAHARKK